MDNNGYLINKIRKISFNGMAAGISLCGAVSFGIVFWLREYISAGVFDESFFDYFDSVGKIIVFAAGCAVVSLSLIFIVKNLFTLLNPKIHGAYKQLAKTSDDLKRELENMDSEMSDSQTKKLKSFTVSKSWTIFHPRLAGIINLSIYLNRMESLVWVYVDQTSEYYGPMPSGTDYKIHVHEKDCQYTYKTDDANEASAFLEAVRYFKPQTFFGYSPRLSIYIVTARNK